MNCNLIPTAGVGWNAELAPENRCGAKTQTLSEQRQEKQQRLRTGVGQQANYPKQGWWWIPKLDFRD
jgi:hypothetical protein